MSTITIDWFSFGMGAGAIICIVAFIIVGAMMALPSHNGEHD